MSLEDRYAVFLFFFEIRTTRALCKLTYEYLKHISIRVPYVGIFEEVVILRIFRDINVFSTIIIQINHIPRYFVPLSSNDSMNVAR